MKIPECLVCGAKDLRAKPSSWWESLQDAAHGYVALSWNRYARVVTHLCAQCGWVQKFLKEDNDRHYVADHWPRVEPHGHSPWHHERTGCLVPLERRHPAPMEAVAPWRTGGFVRSLPRPTQP